MTKVYIIGAKRTAIGSFSGSLQNTGAVDLGSAVVTSLLAESKINPADVNEVILGNVLSAGLGQNISRQISIKAGLPIEIPSFSVNKVCGSGMKAVQLAYQSIITGDSDVIIAGGAENMNQAPYLAKNVRLGLRLNDSVLEDSMVKDGLWCAMGNYHMGITAENIAKKYNISRTQQDEFAYNSHQKAVKAIKNGEFKDEIVPVIVKKGREKAAFDTDEHPKPDTSLEKLASLRAAFEENGTVTAGNSSGINDGAAALILASEKYVKERNIQPFAEITGFVSVGVSPEIMGVGPTAAINRLLAKTCLKLDDIDLFELNEAFAVQSLAVLNELKINPELVNVNGGAIALGHPIGASGARILITLLHAMKKRNLKTGLASLCIGGGMGIAMTVRIGDL